MLAQGEAESSLDVKAIGDHDTAFGLHQWHGDRCDAIKAGCGIDPRTDGLIENHVLAANWELHNSERAALMKIEAATTAMDAGIAACVFYERAGASMAAQRRGAMSERWAVLFSSDTGKALLIANQIQA